MQNGTEARRPSGKMKKERQAERETRIGLETRRRKARERKEGGVRREREGWRRGTLDRRTVTLTYTEPPNSSTLASTCNNVTFNNKCERKSIK